MITGVMYFVLGCCAVFFVGTVVRLALAPFAMSKGLVSLRKEDVRAFLTQTHDVPRVVKAIVAIRKIQNVSWILAVVCSMAVTVWIYFTM